MRLDGDGVNLLDRKSQADEQRPATRRAHRPDRAVVVALAVAETGAAAVEGRGRDEQEVGIDDRRLGGWLARAEAGGNQPVVVAS